MRPVVSALAVGAALVATGAVHVALGRDARAQATIADSSPAWLEPVTAIGLEVIPSDLVATRTDVWATVGIGGVIRVDSRSGRIVARIPTGGAVIAALAQGHVWVVDVADDRLLEIDSRHDRVGRETRVDGLPMGAAATSGRLWVIAQEHGSVTVVDARSLRSVAVLRFAAAELVPAAIVAAGRGVWLITNWGREVSMIDPKTLEIVAHVATPSVDSLAASAGLIWARRSAEGPAGLVRIDPRRFRAHVVEPAGAAPITALVGGKSL
jgi:DNA-binding beta-propeller fold protein YncE